MLKTHHYEDKSYELALQKCLTELNTTENDLYVKTTEAEGKLFKAKKVELSVLKKEDVRLYIKDYIDMIAQGMGIEIQSEIKEVDDIFQVILVSNENGILIGKDGRTLNAIQLLIRQSIQVLTNFNIKVNIDAGNYKAKKIKNFEHEMKKIMNEVQRTKINAKLDPMNSYQRRLVHHLANQYEHLSTKSYGEGKDRYIEIQYHEN